MERDTTKNGGEKFGVRKGVGVGGGRIERKKTKRGGKPSLDVCEPSERVDSCPFEPGSRSPCCLAAHSSLRSRGVAAPSGGSAHSVYFLYGVCRALTRLGIGAFVREEWGDVLCG